MNYSFRRLMLVFILLLAIPFQGVASTLMFSCEMSHGLENAISTHEHDSHVVPHSDSDSSEHAHASFDGQSSVIFVSSGSFDHHSFDSDIHKNHLKHNSCGSSSAAGAIASTELLLATPLDNHVVFTYISSLHLPPVLAGLDRPPRHVLA